MGNSTLPLGGGDTTKLSEVILQPGHTFAPGDAVRPDTANPEEYILAQADTAANAEAVGIVESVAGPSFQIVFQGKVILSSVTWGDLPFLSLSEVWFLSDTVAGELTRTPPSTAGTVIKAMLVVNNITGGSEEGILTGYIGVQIGGDNTVNIDEIQPLASIQPWAAPGSQPVPVGWALCDGQELDRTTFVDLFNLIGTDYGVGDGSTTFNVPDLRGRAAIGFDGVTAGTLTDPGGAGLDNVGTQSGEEEHILTIQELPDHQLTLGVNLVAFTGGVNQALVPLGTGNGGDVPQGFTPDPANPPNPIPGNAHNNMQPLLVINFIIRTTKLASAALLDHNLGDHSDVDVPLPAEQPTEPADGDVLTYNTTTNKWEAAPAAVGGVASTSVFSFRNQLINGRFDVWQRGQSFTFGGTLLDGSSFFQPGFGDYTADRWVMSGEPDGGVTTASVTRVTSVLGDTFDGVTSIPEFYADVENFVVGGGGAESSLFCQRIEGVRTFADEQVTASFWINGNGTAGQMGVSFIQRFGTGGSPSANVFVPVQLFNIDNSGNWQYITLTFSIPSIAGKTLGTIEDNLTFCFNIGTQDYQGTFSVANVQLELGTTATAFEIRELETEIALCQRYFCKAHNIDTAPFNMSAVPGVQDASQNNTPGIYETHSDINSGGNTATMNFPVRMRAAPSLLVVQVQPSNGPTAVQSLTANFVGEGSVSWRSQNTLVAFLWVADSELGS